MTQMLELLETIINKERVEVAYKDKSGMFFDPNHSEFYAVPNNPTKGKVPITFARRYELPRMHRPRPGIEAPRNPNEGTNFFRSIYLPKPMPEEMKQEQNPDWLYTRQRKYARPLLYEPMERAKRTIPLAGKLATTSLSSINIKKILYQIPENHLPKNPEFSATLAPNKAFVNNIQANITRGKRYTHAPLNQRYLYNNITDIEKKFYDGELTAAITANEGVRSEHFYKTPLSTSIPEDIYNQLPYTTRNLSSHIPIETQLMTATKTRNQGGDFNLNKKIIRSMDTIPSRQSGVVQPFSSRIESRRGDTHLIKSKLDDFDDQIFHPKLL